MISIIVPTYNEEKYLKKFIDSLILCLQNINEESEILIIDGFSTDNTRSICKKLIRKYPNIILLDNKEKTVPYALNKGINTAKGDTIIRLDAHVEVPKDYISKLLYWQKKLNADNVGAVIETIPYSNDIKSQAIAIAMSNKFGVGNSYFRIGVNKPIMVDTVPFGCYKKEVFEKIGLFDIDLTRNQDDEFNARLIQNGGKIFLIPEIKIKYYARQNLEQLAKMFYQYGYFKPLVNLKLKTPTTIRQFIPPLFVLFVVFGVILSFVNYTFLFSFILGVGFYILVNILVSYKISKEKNNLKLLLNLVKSFFIIHFSYGIGYLKGILDFIIFKKHTKQNLNKINISR